MASMIALTNVEKLVPGKVLPIDRYLVEPRDLWPLGHGGTLYLVARAKNKLYLVAALEQPERSRLKKGDRRLDGWYALANVVPVTDITALRDTLDIAETATTVPPEVEARLRTMFDGEDAPVLAGTGERAALVDVVEDLLEIWRRTRSVDVADLIEHVTRCFPRFDSPLLADRDRDRGRKSWMKAWRDDRAEAMPQLLQNFDCASLDALADAPDDPRIARTLARHVLSGNRDLARPIKRSRDATAWRESSIVSELDPLRYRRLHDAFAFATKQPLVKPLTQEELARVKTIASTLAPDTAEHTLIDAIAEHADEDEPYLVYSDWLLERGHPRGEYIALACQKRRGKLSPALVRRLAALEAVPYLFGPLDDIATTWRRERPRGVDRSLDVYGSTPNLTWREVALHPLARALERVKFLMPPDPQRVAGIAAFARAAPRLRQIDGLGSDVGNALANELGASWRWDGESVLRK